MLVLVPKGGSCQPNFHDSPRRPTACSASSRFARTRPMSSPRRWAVASAGCGRARRASCSRSPRSSSGTGTPALARTSSAAARAPSTRSPGPADARSPGWLADPGDGPVLEFEGLVKLVFADHGTRDDALATIARARRWAVEMNAGSVEAGERFVESDGLYEQRRATTLLLRRLPHRLLCPRRLMGGVGRSRGGRLARGHRQSPDPARAHARSARTGALVSAIAVARAQRRSDHLGVGLGEVVRVRRQQVVPHREP